MAIFAPVNQFENFLYLISSVFAPMTAILITDYFILKKDSSNKIADWTNLVLWVIGFVIYRLFMRIDTPVGNTLPVMVIVVVLSVIVNMIFGGKINAGKNA